MTEHERTGRDSGRRRGRERAGFSLIELLMAIFILGIGIISIAALFPAGIAQQRRSLDDVTGPVVAGNALAVLRSRLEQADFGSYEDFGGLAPRTTVAGDWPWMRPAILNDGSGAIDVFNFNTAVTVSEQSALDGILNGLGYPIETPWNLARYGNTRPEIIIAAEERFYPQQIRGRPQYYWDCMFRRFQGRVQVAIFVYRVSTIGGEPKTFRFTPDYNGPVPLEMLPRHVSLLPGDPIASGTEPWREQPWDAPPATASGAVLQLTGSAAMNPMDWTNADHAWQMDGQWIIDQNNNIHRVLAGRKHFGDPEVELLRPIPAVLPISSFYPFPSDGVNDVVTDIWYLPALVNVTDPATGATQEFSLTPVYATVKDL